MQYLKIGCNIGCMPYIIDITNEKEKNTISIEEFRKDYEEYSNWDDCRFTRLLFGDISTELASKIKNILKYHYASGNAKSVAIIEIYGLINKDELPFPENEYDMQTARILYDYYKFKI